MNLPDAARVAFDQHLLGELRTSTSHKKEVKALIASLETDRPDRALEVANGALALLNALERKTSPLYVRLTHAAAKYVVHEPKTPEDWELAAQVINTVAGSVKRFELMLDPM